MDLQPPSSKTPTLPASLWDVAVGIPPFLSWPWFPFIAQGDTQWPRIPLLSGLSSREG
jgi:hypothetical protein